MSITIADYSAYYYNLYNIRNSNGYKRYTEMVSSIGAASFNGAPGNDGTAATPYGVADVSDAGKAQLDYISEYTKDTVEISEQSKKQAENLAESLLSQFSSYQNYIQSAVDDSETGKTVNASQALAAYARSASIGSSLSELNDSGSYLDYIEKAGINSAYSSDNFSLDLLSSYTGYLDILT